MIPLNKQKYQLLTVSHVGFRNFACICSNIFMCIINLFKYHVLQFAFFTYFILDSFLPPQIVPPLSIIKICHHLYNFSLFKRHLSCLHFCCYHNAITNILVFINSFTQIFINSYWSLYV